MRLAFEHFEGRSQSALMDRTSGPFKQALNKSAFGFFHHLAGHPLFQLPRLAALSRTVLAIGENNVNHHVLCKIAESVPNTGRQWENFQPVDKVDEAIRHIRESGSWILITGAQIDPEYQTLLDTILVELETACEINLRSELLWACATILVGSPNSVTHYHIDSESNFLFQIHGNKEAHLFNQADRSVLSEQDIETFCAVDGSHIRFRPGLEARERVFDLAPGNGIHIPVNAPHWVRNLDDYSVTLTVLFYMRDMTRRAWVYQANHGLRQLGLRPRPPGEIAWRDGIKSSVIGAFSTRSPRDKRDILKSGYRRLSRPLHLLGKPVLRPSGT